ncbi:cell wall-binding repeat-containing protein [Agrococcus sp. Marseille-P2731]|uniref:cell wall-binding repeat-containing protein n=1 Tax=Agrococcus sp. Marseille-P2731 TaxID=1841862 RepID=UPI00093121A2|nr:cell wall-binding repeat-containing protein [Agrococcus sp. Marseille-P2731]
MRSRPRLIVAAVVTALVGALLTVVPSTGSDGQASAANAADFDPGYLISDQQFYDGRAMSATQVQTFIDAKHPGCAAGYRCLDTYAQRTPTMPADAYCAGLAGRSSESAASIIARVGQACNISQRYLLVLLQKEQSLVTSRAPSTRQYTAATGFGCPDTAPCDSSVGGFFYQVYYGARQFQRYAAHPERWSHRAGVTNWVWWHPNQACGRSSITIRNAATAGLYNYTPYRPNAAALANLYGTGNSCSSYGNRNTWRMWSDWFGDPTQTVVQLPTAKRISGTDRYRTAVAVSRSEFGAGVPVVYLASGQNFPDGLSAGPAAAHQGGPVLLTPRAELPKHVLDEIVRLRPQRVVIVGDANSVSAAVETAVRGLWGSRGPLAGATVTVDELPASTDVEQTTEQPSEPAATTEPTPSATAEPTPADTAEPVPSESAEPTASAEVDPAEAVAPAGPDASASPQPSPTATAGSAPTSASELARSQETLAATAADPASPDAQTSAANPVLRLGGKDRFETSRMIAEYAFRSASSAFFATGLRFPDALSAGPAAARRDGPVLLVDNRRGFDAPTRATLQRLGVRWAGVVGNGSSVSAPIASGIASTGATVVRYGGSNRFETSVRLAADFGDVRTAYVVSGQNFPDALAGAAVAGSQNAPMLLTSRHCMPEEVRTALVRAKPESVLVLGGPPTIYTSTLRYTSC